ncbi:protein of unassigned function [Methylobacterium oryzae CBMB20]|uniref:Protein of unassigned function n=1 Tax=Methylobacterium oryzae CBMB20 TaxID=693986 RepID=A0A089QD46_9HYPH|nr:protein of unassigned function [Methylobacterium oryzae CBMB20]
MQRWACKSALRGGTVSACQCGARAQEFGHARSDPISLIRETNCLAGEIYNYQLF